MEVGIEEAPFTGFQVSVLATTLGIVLSALHPIKKEERWANAAMVVSMIVSPFLILLGFRIWQLEAIDLTGWNINGPFWTFCFTAVFVAQLIIHGISMIRGLEFETRFSWILASHWACLWGPLLYTTHVMETPADMVVIMIVPLAGLWILLTTPLMVMLVLLTHRAMPPREQ